MDTAQQPESDFVAVLVTVPSEEVAATLANLLVGERLVACVSILPGVRSIYAWQGKICDERELVCLLKTRRALFPALCQRVLAIHPYQVPEVVALPIVEGNARYLEWLDNETSPSSPDHPEVSDQDLRR